MLRGSIILCNVWEWVSFCKTTMKVRLRLFRLKMNSGKQFTPCYVFGCAWKIWSNGKSFPLTVKYPPHTYK